MRQPTPEDLEAVRADHPNASLIEVSDHELVVAAVPPNEGEWKRYREAVAMTPVKRYTLQKQLVLACTRFPPPVELEDEFKTKPVLVETLFNELSEMAGGSVAATRKKL